MWSSQSRGRFVRVDHPRADHGGVGLQRRKTIKSTAVSRRTALVKRLPSSWRCNRQCSLGTGVATAPLLWRHRREPGAPTVASSRTVAVRGRWRRCWRRQWRWWAAGELRRDRRVLVAQQADVGGVAARSMPGGLDPAIFASRACPRPACAGSQLRPRLAAAAPVPAPVVRGRGWGRSIRSEPTLRAGRAVLPERRHMTATSYIGRGVGVGS